MKAPNTKRRLAGAPGLAALVGFILAAAGYASAAPPPPAIYLPLLAQPAVGGPSIAGCPVFPADHAWNTPIDHLPTLPNSAALIASTQNSGGTYAGLHPDFGTVWNGAPIGIPFVVVPPDQPLVPVSFGYASESDPGPYPIPPDAPIEGGPQSDGDRHVLVLQRGTCRLFELYAAYPMNGGAQWEAGSGAVYDLAGYDLRPAGYTSADAAGLAILPGLVRYEEVAAGEIRHAIRFTLQRTRAAYEWPARHFASNIQDPNVPAMGQRFRLRADFDLRGFSPEVQVILRALQRYGVILADNGANWFISGAPDPRWNDDMLVNELRRVRGSDFEVVDVSSLIIDPDSAQARQP